MSSELTTLNSQISNPAAYPECDQFKDHRRAICRGDRPDVPIDGKNSVNAYRKLWGLHPLGQQPWDVTQPCRGLGDVVAKITHWTGLDKVANYLFPVTTANPQGCGCGKRQEDWNQAVPFQNKGL